MTRLSGAPSRSKRTAPSQPSWLPATSTIVLAFLLGTGAGLLIERIWHPFMKLERWYLGYERIYPERLGLVPEAESMLPLKKGTIDIFRPHLKMLNQLIYQSSPVPAKVAKEFYRIFANQLATPDLRLLYLEKRDSDGFLVRQACYRQAGLGLRVTLFPNGSWHFEAAVDNGSHQYDVLISLTKCTAHIFVNKQVSGYAANGAIETAAAASLRQEGQFLLEEAHGEHYIR